MKRNRRTGILAGATAFGALLVGAPVGVGPAGAAPETAAGRARAAVSTAVIEGLGAIRFGVSMEDVLATHEGVRWDPDHPDQLRLQAEVDGFPIDPDITLSFHQGRLEEVFVYGPIMEAGIGKRLTSTYGRPASVRKVRLPDHGDATEASWVDPHGNRVTLLIYHGPHDVSLRYVAGARAAREAASSPGKVAEAGSGKATTG
jgi:hypothetical protein